MSAFLDDARQRDRLLLQFVTTGLDAGEIEDLVDQHQQMLSAGMDVGGVFLVSGYVQGPEQLGLHHFGETEDRIERRAQFVAHRRQETRLREIGALGATTRLIRIELGLLELGDQRVLFGLEGEARERGSMQPIGQNHEIDQHAAAQNRERRKLARRIRAEDGDDADHHRQQAGADGGWNRRRHHRRHAGNQHQHDENEAAGAQVGRVGRQQHQHRPYRAGAGLGNHEIDTPAAGHPLGIAQTHMQEPQAEAQRKRRQGQTGPNRHLGRRRPERAADRRRDDQQAVGQRSAERALREQSHETVIGSRVIAGGTCQGLARMA